MTKTIEEAASEYYLNEVINGDTCDDKDGWTDCFVSGAKALMQLPLASRLIAEEKEQIRFAHKMAKDFAERVNPMSAEVFKAQYMLLESIFGADFFKEGE